MEWTFFPVSFHRPKDRGGRTKPEKHVGRTTRMGIEQYQDYTLYINEDRGALEGRRLTDEQLCADWQHEFPEAVTFTPFHVQGVRRDYQAGTPRADGTGSAHGIRDASGEVIGGGSSRQY